MSFIQTLGKIDSILQELRRYGLCSPPPLENWVLDPARVHFERTIDIVWDGDGDQCRVTLPLDLLNESDDGVTEWVRRRASYNNPRQVVGFISLATRDALSIEAPLTNKDFRILKGPSQGDVTFVNRPWEEGPGGVVVAAHVGWVTPCKTDFETLDLTARMVDLGFEADQVDGLYVAYLPRTKADAAIAILVGTLIGDSRVAASEGNWLRSLNSAERAIIPAEMGQFMEGMDLIGTAWKALGRDPDDVEWLLEVEDIE